MGDDLELLDGFHTKQLSPGPTGSEVLRVVHVRSVQHEHVGGQTRAADRKLTAAPLVWTASRRSRHIDPRLQKNQLIEAAAVERERTNGLSANQPPRIRRGCL